MYIKKNGYKSQLIEFQYYTLISTGWEIFQLKALSCVIISGDKMAASHENRY